MAATSEPSAGLLEVGHQCSSQYCNLVDFLPFKCQHCERKFCGEHYLPTSHNCDKYDERKHNRVAPSCGFPSSPYHSAGFADSIEIGPLCNTPVTIPDGQDPNLPVERHITNECSVMTGKTKKSNQPHCANPRCKKLLFAPIRCDVSDLDLDSGTFRTYRRCRNATSSSAPSTVSRPTIPAIPRQRKHRRNR